MQILDFHFDQLSFHNWRHRWCCIVKWMKLIYFKFPSVLVPTTAQSLCPPCMFARASVRDVDPFYPCSVRVAAAVQQQGRFLWAKAGADHRRWTRRLPSLLTTNPAHPTLHLHCINSVSHWLYFHIYYHLYLNYL